MSAAYPLLLNVRRHEPVLVVPAKPTPKVFKPLSDIDDHQALRFQIPTLHFYKYNPSEARSDPVKVIRDALAEALVFYYPFAGRLIERPDKKLVVDCTSESGVLFVEGDTDAKLDQVLNVMESGRSDLFVDELLHNVEGSDGIVNCPLLLIQVTRFRCGGFSFGVRLNHTMSDAPGITQFLSGLAELARGENLSVSPVWQRESFLTARQPPQITCQHVEFEDTSPEAMMTDMEKNLIHRLFFFGPNDIETLRYHLPKQENKKYSTFNLLAACLWRCRTRAMELNPNQTVRFLCVANGRFTEDLKVPHGYYGNVFGYPAVAAKSGVLCSRPMGYAVELVKKAKEKFSGEYLRSLADFMVINQKPLVDMKWNFFVSDTRAIGFHEIDFGWGKPIFGGPARSIFPISFLARFKGGVVVPLCMPEPVMEKFQEELKKILITPNRFDLKSML